ncbi:ethanolamine ammonia-lyase subunit EutC [Rhizorhabdus dicambivorans]|uniref:Ethanolamine ammonia-lyase small subunit n=1 Tax=Rhizorhabdus dicambivorans TaxID=1850238 RepID=A0A2A4FWP8_9SPHN|nr:ethanolamine ammonia-lyase subunit EutC [Rhizorhabdus dicambivorans]ATE66294.1 ethanolamine ammonia-lyase subunit EutC [Rhizorhabdus dicambivorans]PCE41811.1 ethanolamine ammonia-lyase subunit EutC [Rhizorhabdus dicambivorans]
MTSDVENRTPDIFEPLRALTSARIGLGRFAQGVPSVHSLDFQRCHALARDAVHQQLDVESMADVLNAAVLHSRAADRAQYLQRPDLGRRLDSTSAKALSQGHYDLAVVIGDGLSSTAVQHHVPALLEALLPLVADLALSPINIVLQARVAVADEVGERLGAKLVLMLLGERPGLSSSDSLGAYLTFAPKVGRRDHERNCVSNIRPEGLPPVRAAHTIGWLIRQALSLGATGIALKDGSDSDGSAVEASLAKKLTG